MPYATAEFQPLYRSARAQAMGGAFTAVANDEGAIFYNPAGLAGIKKFSFHVLDLNVEGSNDLVNHFGSFISAFKEPDVSAVDVFLGQNLSARMQATSTLILPNFGIALIGDAQAGIHLQNPAYPSGKFGQQLTYGVQASLGTTLVRFRKKKGEVRFGVSGKLLWRSGGYIQTDLTKMLTLNVESIKRSLAPMGSGYGVDTGVQVVYNLRKNLRLQGGLAMTDIGNTAFSSGAASQNSNLTMGLAAIFKNADVIATFAYDYTHVLENLDWRKKNHLGVELKFFILSLYAGLNQVYPTYGAGFNLGLFELMYTSYGEELATLVNQDPERRSLIRFAMKFDL